MLPKRCVLVICDSLRNDLLGASTPTLLALAQQGTRFTRAQSVFPSTTRVSSACIATGCHPEQHGLLGNTMILDEPDGLVTRSVGKPEFRQQLYAATKRYLRVPTLAERLHHKMSTALYSNVSPGAAYFFDPAHFGYVYHRAGSYGPCGRRLEGEEGLEIASGAAGDQQMTRRFCDRLLSDDSLGLAVLWLSEPDASGHAHLPGSEKHHDAIGHADTCVATVWEAVEKLRARDQDILFMAGSDHGMETISHEIDIGQALVEAGFKQSPQSRDIVVAPNGTAAVLGFDEHYALLDRLLQWLPAQPWVGEFVSGEQLHAWGMPDEPACRIAISLAGSNADNALGVPGMAWYATDPDDPKHYLGQGQHGGRHVHEQHPFLIVQGGGFVRDQISEPVSLIDYAPTILHHLGMPANGMQGKALHAFFAGHHRHSFNAHEGLS